MQECPHPLEQQICPLEQPEPHISAHAPAIPDFTGGHRGSSSAEQWVLPCLLWLLLSMATPLAAQPRCSSGKELALTMSYSTNATGHRAVSANLEQPLGSPGWLLDVEVRTSGCAPDDVPLRSLTISLKGPPEVGFLDRSPAASTPSTPFTPPTPSTPSTSATTRPAPPGYLTLPDLGHYRAPPEARNWAAARDFCRKEGAGLWTPTSQREVEVLLQHFSANATGAVLELYFWHSANDNAQEGKFVTEDGVPLEDTGFAQFGPRKPSKSSTYNCLVIHTSNRLLYDIECTKQFSFICKVNL